MENIIKREQRYHDMIKEALNIGRIIKGEPIDECREEVIDILPSDISFTQYRKIAAMYMLPEYTKDLEFDYQAEALAAVKYIVVKDGVEYADMVSMRVLYTDDKNFLRLANTYEEDGVVLNQNGQVGWRDLREHDELDWIIYDYFRDENDNGRILRFRKPEIEGDYSNQTPEAVATYVI